MNDSDETLTIAYGAFRCSLEGFAQPINVLRDILARLAETEGRLDPDDLSACLPEGVESEEVEGGLRLRPARRPETAGDADAAVLRLGEPVASPAPGPEEAPAAEPALRYEFSQAPRAPAFRDAAQGGFVPASAGANAPFVGTLDRLMDEAGAQIEADESRRRISALAHMRRAVAATRAEDALHGREEETGPDSFREELRRSVRPDEMRRAAEVPPLRLDADRRFDPGAGPLRLGEPQGPGPRADLADRLERTARAAGPGGMPREALIAASVEPGEEAPKADWLRAVGLLLREQRLRRTEAGCYVPREAEAHSPPPDSSGGG